MKKVLSLLLAVITLCSVTSAIHFSASATVLPSSGWCSDTAKFTFNKSTGTLTISGKGAVNRNAFSNKSEIKKLIVKKGVKRIESNEFKGCKNLNSIVLPEGLTFIGKDAFANTAYYNNKNNWQNHALYCKKYLLQVDKKYFKTLRNNAVYNKNYIYSYSIKSGTVLIAEGAIPKYKSSSHSRFYINLPSSLKYLCGTMSADTVKYDGTKDSFKKIKVWNSSKKKFVSGTNFGYKKVRYNIAYPPKVVSLTTNKLKNAFTITWKKQAKTNGYQIQYSLKKNMSAAKTKTIKGNKKTKLTVKKLKAKKTYYVRMRAYRVISGKKVYGEWTKITPTIKPSSKPAKKPVTKPSTPSTPSTETTTKTDKVTTTKKPTVKPVAPKAPKKAWTDNVKKDSLVLHWASVKCNGYEVQYSDNGQTFKSLKKSTTATEIEVNGLASNTQYTFRIRAYNENKCGRSVSAWVKTTGKTEASNEKREITFHISLPIKANEEDTLILTVGDDQYIKKVNLDGSTVTIKTVKKYKGAVMFKAKLKNTGSSYSGETDNEVCSFSMSGGGIHIIEGDDD